MESTEVARRASDYRRLIFVLFTQTAHALFRDRREAGRQLAVRLEHFREQDPLVLGLPRGGVPVAFEVARALEAPLDVVLVRKLGAPMHPELGMGAIGEDGVCLVDARLVDVLGVQQDELDATVSREQEELQRRHQLYRRDREPLVVTGRTVLLVDDGIATGATARAAAETLRRRGAGRVVLAVPLGPPGVENRFPESVDEVVCLESPEGFFAVGAYYERFDQTSDDEVIDLLERARAERHVVDEARVAATQADPPPRMGGIDFSQVRQRRVEIPAGEITLIGDLSLPPTPTGLVIFAHGSGSSRLSPRNVQVAGALNGAGLATLLFDLLTEREEHERRNVFDIDLLADRLVSATRWAQGEADLRRLPIGYFGASTGAAAALRAAADLDGEVRAVVSRGGRPDLAAERLHEVTAPTLLVVGAADHGVIELNERALAMLRCRKELELVSGATHLFPEPGALSQVARLTARWFAEHLASMPEAADR